MVGPGMATARDVAAAAELLWPPGTGKSAAGQTGAEGGVQPERVMSETKPFLVLGGVGPLANAWIMP